MTQLTATSLPSSAPSQSVEVKLRRAWRKQRRFVHLRGVCHLLLWLVALAATDFMVDWLFQIPGWGRMAMLGLNGAALLGVCWGYWWKHLHRYDPLRLALQVERRHPHLKSLLVSYVQLCGNGPASSTLALAYRGEGQSAGRAQSVVSPSLINALKQRAIDTTAPLDFKQIISYVELKRIALVCMLVLVFAAAVSVPFKSYLRVLAARLLDPHSTMPYPTRTRLDVTADLVVRQGDALTLEVRGRGMTPSEGSLYVQSDGVTWERLPLVVLPGKAADGASVYPYIFQAVHKSFAYYARVGDARTEPRRVKVVSSPRIVKTKASLEFPAYTQRPARISDSLNLEVLQGTQITWELECDPPVATAQLLVGEKDQAAQVTELEVANGGRLVRGKLAADQSLAYRFQWQEPNHKFVFQEEVRHYLQVMPDLPPEVEITAPGSDEKATAQKELTIDFRGSDDYGIAKAMVVYSINDGPEKTRDIPNFTGGQGRHVWKLRDALPSFKEGESLVLSYAIEVQDNFPGKEGPHRSRSSNHSLTILSRAEYQQYMYERIGRLLDEIKDVHGQEQQSSQEVKSLKEMPTTQESK